MLEAVQTLTGHSDRVWNLAWNPTGTILASSGADRTIRLWAKNKSDEWVCVSILTETHNKSIRRLCWSPCGTYLASASFDSTVCIWKRHFNDGSWSTVVNLEGHESEVKSVAWSCDGNYLASCGRDRTIWIWERATDDIDNRDYDSVDNAVNWDCSDVKNDHTKDVKHIVWHPNYPILASCSYDDTVKLFHREADDWTCFETLNVHTSTVWSADFSASGEHLVTCSDDKTVRIWKNHAHYKLPIVETNSWKCINVIQGYHNRTIYDVSWSKHDNVIASAAGDNSIAIYGVSSDDSQDGCDIFICFDKLARAHECDVNSVQWNPKISGLLASAGDDRKVKLWNYKNEERGRKTPTTIDELLQSISALRTQTNKESPTTSKTTQHADEATINLSVDSFSKLSDCIRVLQNLRSEIFYDLEKHLLEKLLDLKFTRSSPSWIDIATETEDKTGFVKEISTKLVNDAGTVQYKFIIAIDSSKLELLWPRRSIKLTYVLGELFLVDKTGDLFKILPSGAIQFLLGHLFILSDVQFITNNKGDKILYVISADRDEKIRISNYPQTFDIERFCFGHKNYLKRLIVIDETRFVSLDQQNEICLWDLERLRRVPGGKPLLPERTLCAHEKNNKRICLRT